MKKSSTKIIGIIFTLLLLGSVFYFRATRNLIGGENKYSNFFVFWLSGKLLTEGKSPYDPSDWLLGHQQYVNVVPRDNYFLYPLTLAVLMTPISLLPLGQAYITWLLVTQVALGLIVFMLLKYWKDPAHGRLLLPLVIFLLYYGPLYLALRVGSVGIIALLLIYGFIFLIERKIPFAAGFVVAFTMLKPPQGLIILLLIGIWLLARGEWRGIQGIVVGGIVFWLIGAAVDLNWVSKFQKNGEVALPSRLGFQSNVWSLAYRFCAQNISCTYIIGGILALGLLALCAHFLWKDHDRYSAWEILNVIIPVGFITTVFMWSYDQILYVIPIVWIVGTLVQKTKKYLYAFLFLILITAYSFFALLNVSNTQNDLWSWGNTLLVLSGVLLAYQIKETSAVIQISS